MKTLACIFALLLAFASPAFAQMHGHGGGHGGGGYHGGHGGGMGGFHGGYGGGGGYHGGYEHRHFHGEGYPDEVRPYCTPWQLAAGMCGPDY